jgi:hypothetical protein
MLIFARILMHIVLEIFYNNFQKYTLIRVVPLVAIQLGELRTYLDSFRNPNKFLKTTAPSLVSTHTGIIIQRNHRITCVVD